MDVRSIFLGRKLVIYIVTIGMMEMDIIWPIKNKIFAYGEKKTIVKFVTKQLQLVILEYLLEQENMERCPLEPLQPHLLRIVVIFVIKDVVVMELWEILSDLKPQAVAIYIFCIGLFLVVIVLLSQD